jgi:hypothetical protein
VLQCDHSRYAPASLSNIRLGYRLSSDEYYSLFVLAISDGGKSFRALDTRWKDDFEMTPDNVTQVARELKLFQKQWQTLCRATCTLASKKVTIVFKVNRYRLGIYSIIEVSLWHSQTEDYIMISFSINQYTIPCQELCQLSRETLPEEKAWYSWPPCAN